MMFQSIVRLEKRVHNPYVNFLSFRSYSLWNFCHFQPMPHDSSGNFPSFRSCIFGLLNLFEHESHDLTSNFLSFRSYSLWKSCCFQPMRHDPPNNFLSFKSYIQLCFPPTKNLHKTLLLNKRQNVAYADFFNCNSLCLCSYFAANAPAVPYLSANSAASVAWIIVVS